MVGVIMGDVKVKKMLDGKRCYYDDVGSDGQAAFAIKIDVDVPWAHGFHINKKDYRDRISQHDRSALFGGDETFNNDFALYTDAPVKVKNVLDKPEFREMVRKLFDVGVEKLVVDRQEIIADYPTKVVDEKKQLMVEKACPVLIDLSKFMGVIKVPKVDFFKLYGFYLVGILWLFVVVFNSGYSFSAVIFYSDWLDAALWGSVLFLIGRWLWEIDVNPALGKTGKNIIFIILCIITPPLMYNFVSFMNIWKTVGEPVYVQREIENRWSFICLAGRTQVVDCDFVVVKSWIPGEAFAGFAIQRSGPNSPEVGRSIKIGYRSGRLGFMGIDSIEYDPEW
ncbi:MAG: hypothetical protein HQL52_01245 [Magnetococcales bacterium]|nr:hypothetical protein [Magnetococcales bacterium]